MKILGCIIISLFAIMPVHGQGADSTAVEEEVNGKLMPDTTKSKFIPTGIRIGFDLISFGQAVIKNGVSALTQGEFREIQFSADIDFYRYFLNLEYGRFETEWLSPNGFYTIEGQHYKVGPDVNFLKNDPEGNALFFGIRYSWNKFSDNAIYEYEDAVWGDGAIRVSNNDISANWFELTTGLKVKLTRLIWLGYTARFKFAYGIDTFADNQLIPHWVPGYGRADAPSRWGLDYWLIIRLPFDGLKEKPQVKK